MNYIDQHRWELWLRGAPGAYRGARQQGMTPRRAIRWVWRGRPFERENPARVEFEQLLDDLINRRRTVCRTATSSAPTWPESTTPRRQT